MLKTFILNRIRASGYELHRIPRRSSPQLQVAPEFDKIHYGCGRIYLPGWLNTDIIADGPENYMYVDLVGRHPFPDDSFRYGFSEDFIEHVDQASALMFLLEAHRTLKPGGVLRITTPDLARVLSKHYRRCDYTSFETGREEAYAMFGHVHFFSRESLTTVAHYIGFEIEFVEGGKSAHVELDNLNTRSDEVYLHAELTKLSR